MQLNCPLPEIDFDIITLGHGSGGLLTSKLLDQIIFKAFSNEVLDKKQDGGVFELAGKLAFSTDSYVVSPLFFPGGDIGHLSIHGTVNDLAMCGAIPKYLSLSFIIEEGLSVKDFWEVIQSIKKASIEANIHIVTGDTKVVEKGKGDQLFINTAGIGVLHPKANLDINRIASEDKIIVSHSIAHHGMAIMSVREGMQFETEIKSDTTHLNEITLSLIEEFGSHIKLFRDPTRGGVATTLNEIVEGTPLLGAELYERAMRIDPSVQSACELLGLDPLYVANEGVFIAIVAPEVEQNIIKILHQNPKTNQAFCAGHFSKKYPKKVLMHSNLGGKRFISKLVGEQLPRIC